MDNVIKTIGKFAKTIGMALLFAAVGFILIYAFASIGGGFMPVLSGLILLVFNVVLFGAIPVLIILKKEDLIKYVLAPLFSFWIIQSVSDYVGSGADLIKKVPGLIAACSTFEFLIGCALIAVIVFAVLYFFTKKKTYLQIGFAVFACTSLFFLLVWILKLARYSKYDYEWQIYIYAFYQYLFVPFGLIFIVLDFLLGKTQGAQIVASATASDADPLLDTESMEESKNEEAGVVESEGEAQVDESDSSDSTDDDGDTNATEYEGDAADGSEQPLIDQPSDEPNA